MRPYVHWAATASLCSRMINVVAELLWILTRMEEDSIIIRGVNTFISFIGSTAKPAYNGIQKNLNHFPIQNCENCFFHLILRTTQAFST